MPPVSVEPLPQGSAGGAALHIVHPILKSERWRRCRESLLICTVVSSRIMVPDRKWWGSGRGGAFGVSSRKGAVRVDETGNQFPTAAGAGVGPRPPLSLSQLTCPTGLVPDRVTLPTEHALALDYDTRLSSHTQGGPRVLAFTTGHNRAQIAKQAIMSATNPNFNLQEAKCGDGKLPVPSAHATRSATSLFPITPTVHRVPKHHHSCSRIHSRTSSGVGRSGSNQYNRRRQ